ncbi:MAG: hypothetical protein MUC32_11465 [Burkholderiaceae bacterium]|nr:hypothetical protein [Burkholderiaceae bacterium]
MAAWYGKSPDEFRQLLLTDRRLKIDQRGRLFVEEELDAPLPATTPSGGASDALSGTLAPLDQTFLLHSRPGAQRLPAAQPAGRAAHDLPQLPRRDADQHGVEQQRQHDHRRAVRHRRRARHVLAGRAAAHAVHLATRGRGLRGVRCQRDHRTAVGRPRRR